MCTLSSLFCLSASAWPGPSSLTWLGTASLSLAPSSRSLYGGQSDHYYFRPLPVLPFIVTHAIKPRAASKTYKTLRASPCLPVYSHRLKPSPHSHASGTSIVMASNTPPSYFLLQGFLFTVPAAWNSLPLALSLLSSSHSSGPTLKVTSSKRLTLFEARIEPSPITLHSIALFSAFTACATIFHGLKNCICLFIYCAFIREGTLLSCPSPCQSWCQICFYSLNSFILTSFLSPFPFLNTD